MIGTFNCVYETPCGWCSKWDKRCDNKSGSGWKMQYQGKDVDTPNECTKSKDPLLEDIKAGRGLNPLSDYPLTGLREEKRG